MRGVWHSGGKPRLHERVEVAFRPGVVLLGEGQPHGANVLNANILTTAFLGHSIDYAVKVNEFIIRAETSPDTIVAAGSSTSISIPENHAYIYRSPDVDAARTASDD